MSPGYQLTQSCHVAMHFMLEHNELANQWIIKSDYLCILSVENEIELQKLIEQANFQNIILSIFKEPDIDNQITAIALAPGNLSKKLCSKLKLALKEK